MSGGSISEVLSIQTSVSLPLQLLYYSHVISESNAHDWETLICETLIEDQQFPLQEDVQTTVDVSMNDVWEDTSDEERNGVQGGMQRDMEEIAIDQGCVVTKEVVISLDDDPR